MLKKKNSDKKSLLLRNRNLSILLIGQIISLFGSAIQRFALSLYILDWTGSGSIFSMILATSMVPIVLLAPIAGVLADRSSRKKIMVYLDFISAGLMLLYTVIMASGKEGLIGIGALMFLLSMISTLYQPAVTASIPELTKEEDRMVANGLVYQISSLSNFLGPILAGLLYGFMGIQGIFILNAISFFLSGVMECFLVMKPQPKMDSAEGVLSIFWSDIKESSQYLKKDNRIVFRMIITSGLYNLFLVPVFSVGAPYIIKITLGMSSEVYGIAEGIIAVGMIIGATIVSMKPDKFHIKTIYRLLYGTCMSMCCMGLSLLLPMGSANIRWVILCSFTLFAMMIMLILGIANVVSATYIQGSTTTNMLGKISAYSLAFATFCIPFGQLLFGYLLDILAGQTAILVIGAAICSLFVTFIVRWNVRQIP